MSKHTAGPWKVVGTEIWGTNHRVAYGKGAYDDKDREHNKANARLIAAAPEMYRLLKACGTIIDTMDKRLSDMGKGLNMSNLPGYEGQNFVDWIGALLTKIEAE